MAHFQTCGACNPGPCIRLSCTRNSTWVGQYLERHRQLNRQPRGVAAACAAPAPVGSWGVGWLIVNMLFGYPSAMPSASRVTRVHQSVRAHRSDVTG